MPNARTPPVVTLARKIKILLITQQERVSQFQQYKKEKEEQKKNTKEKEKTTT